MTNHKGVPRSMMSCRMRQGGAASTDVRMRNLNKPRICGVECKVWKALAGVGAALQQSARKKRLDPQR